MAHPSDGPASCVEGGGGGGSLGTALSIRLIAWTFEHGVCGGGLFCVEGGTSEEPNDDGTRSSALPVGLTHSCASSWLSVCSHGKRVLQGCRGSLTRVSNIRFEVSDTHRLGPAPLTPTSPAR
jgi:hypothetical protein